MLGHIICKDGVNIDPERIVSIAKIPLPLNKKGLQSFFGTINFLRRFIPNLAEVTKPLNRLLRNDVKFQWDDTSRRAFQQLKDSCAQAPVLISPDYSKDFYIFFFASEDTMASVLLQKNDQGQEQPIAYMSKILRDSELKYHMVEKQICFGEVT